MQKSNKQTEILLNQNSFHAWMQLPELRGYAENSAWWMEGPC